jgi:hypothetical protein
LVCDFCAAVGIHAEHRCGHNIAHEIEVWLFSQTAKRSQIRRPGRRADAWIDGGRDFHPVPHARARLVYDNAYSVIVRQDHALQILVPNLANQFED